MRGLDLVPEINIWKVNALSVYQVRQTVCTVGLSDRFLRVIELLALPLPVAPQRIAIERYPGGFGLEVEEIQSSGVKKGMASESSDDVLLRMPGAGELGGWCWGGKHGKEKVGNGTNIST